MTDHRLQQLYQAAARAAHTSTDRVTATAFDRSMAERNLAQALDVIIMGCDGQQAGLVEWAMDNGYPDWETVLRYGDHAINK